MPALTCVERSAPILHLQGDSLAGGVRSALPEERISPLLCDPPFFLPFFLSSFPKAARIRQARIRSRRPSGWTFSVHGVHTDSAVVKACGLCCRYTRFAELLALSVCFRLCCFFQAADLRRQLDLSNKSAGDAVKDQKRLISELEATKGVAEERNRLQKR